MHLTKSTKSLWVGVLLFSLCFVTRLAFINLPLDRDEGTYAYIGSHWLSGQGIPYLTVYDNKPPLLYLTYGLFSKTLGGPVQRIRLWSTIYASIITLVWFLFLKKITKFPLAVGGSLALIFLLNNFYIESSNLNAETLLLLPLTIMLWLVWSSLSSYKKNSTVWFFIGLCSACTILYKQTAIYLILPITVYYLIQKGWRPWWWIMIGGLVPMALIVIYFSITGSLGPLISDVIVWGGRFGTYGWLPSEFCPSPLTTGACVGTWLLRFHWAILPVFLVSGFTLLISRQHHNHVWWLATLLWLGSLLAIKAAGAWDYPHYYILTLPSIILSLVILSSYLEQNKYTATNIIMTTLIIGWGLWLYLPALIQSPTQTLTQEYGSELASIFNDAVTVGDWLKTNTPATETVYVAGNEAEVYYYADREATTKFITSYLFEAETKSDNKLEWWKTVTKSPPEWVIIPTQLNHAAKNLLIQLFTYQTYTETTKIGSYLIYNKS